jgi:uncharacterized spore protein YtfJ
LVKSRDPREETYCKGKGERLRVQDESVNATIEPIRRMLEHTGVKAVFGEPIRVGSVTVIPVAEATVLFGGGIGFYPGPTTTNESQDSRNGAAGVDGAGGGYVGRAKPRGYIRISPDGSVEYEALVDPVRRALGGVALLAGALSILLGIIRATRG